MTGTRTLYFCDWCGVESPKTPHDWRTTHYPKPEHVCKACIDALEAAIVRVKVERAALVSRAGPKGDT